jgi:hypothetical protein
MSALLLAVMAGRGLFYGYTLSVKIWEQWSKEGKRAAIPVNF